MKINSKLLLAITTLCMTGLLSSCHVPGTHPSLIGREELHLIFDLTVSGHTYEIDYTGSWDSAISHHNDNFAEVDFSYTIEIDYGLDIRRFELLVPMPLVTGVSYSRADFPDATAGDYPMYIQLYHDDDTNSWRVHNAEDDAEGTYLNLTIDGHSEEFVWASFDARLKRLGYDEYITVDGQFSARKSWVYD